MIRPKIAGISIIHDCIIKRINLKHALSEYNQKVISDFSNAESFIQSLKTNIPNIVLIKLNLKSMNGIEATQRIKSVCPDIKVILLSDTLEKEIFDASMFLGVSAFVSENIEIKKLVRIIDAVNIGAYWFEPKLTKLHKCAFPKPVSFDLPNLYKKNDTDFELTKREREVLRLVVEGKTNIEIANEMIVSINTAKAHVGNILTKMHVTDRVQAAVKAVQSNLL